MATKIKQAGRRPDIESDLTEKYHVGWEYWENVPTAHFDIDKSLANQARFEAINEDTVEQYAAAAARGDLFPAVIAYRPRKGGKLVIIDGNHRLVAHDRAGVPLDVYEIEGGTRGQTIQLMTYAFNTRHGRPTSETERVMHALYLIDNNATIPMAAEAVNIPERILKRAVTKQNADRRAAEVGVDPREWEALSQAARGRLLNISTDEGLKDAAHLAFAARLGVEEVFELVTLLNATKSANRQRAIVKSAMMTHQDRIQAGGGGTFSTNDRRAPSPKARIGMVLGQITALPEDVVQIAKTYGEAERAGITQAITDAIEKLTKVRMAIDPNAS